MYLFHWQVKATFEVKIASNIFRISRKVFDVEKNLQDTTFIRLK